MKLLKSAVPKGVTVVMFDPDFYGALLSQEWWGCTLARFYTAIRRAILHSQESLRALA